MKPNTAQHTSLAKLAKRTLATALFVGILAPASSYAAAILVVDEGGRLAGGTHHPVIAAILASFQMSGPSAKLRPEGKVRPTQDRLWLTLDG